MRYSIIIPVLNESGIINNQIEYLRKVSSAGSCEIIVSDGSPAGDTVAVIYDPGIRCLAAPLGRARQMNAGAAVANGEILIFLHADTQLPANALKLIDNVMSRQDIVGGAFDLGINSDRFIYRLISFVASLRSRITRIPYGDQAVFVRRSYFNRIGGFPDIPLMEDVAFMRRIKEEGGRIDIIPVCVGASPRRWEKEGIIYTTLRNWLLLTAYLLGVSPARLTGCYRAGRLAYDNENEIHEKGKDSPI